MYEDITIMTVSDMLKDKYDQQLKTSRIQRAWVEHVRRWYDISFLMFKAKLLNLRSINKKIVQKISRIPSTPKSFEKLILVLLEDQDFLEYVKQHFKFEVIIAFEIYYDQIVKCTPRVLVDEENTLICDIPQEMNDMVFTSEEVIYDHMAYLMDCWCPFLHYDKTTHEFQESEDVYETFSFEK